MEPMMPQVIAFLSAKGGAGKTVLSASLANVLALAGIRTLLVDCDASTNGLTLFYLDEILSNRDGTDDSSSNLTGSFEATPITPPTPVQVADLVDLIPAAFTLRDTEKTPIELFGEALAKTVRGAVAQPYDVVILDAQAGTDEYARKAASVADSVVIVSEYDPISAEGMERLRRLFGEDLPSDSTWTLFNKVLPELGTSLGDFLRIARYLPPIPWDADVVLAFARKELAISARGNSYTVSLIATAQALLPKRLARGLSDWVSTREAALRKPIQSRIQEIDDNVEKLNRAQADAMKHFQATENRMLFGRSILVAAGLGLIAISVVLGVLGERALYVSIFGAIGVLLPAALWTVLSLRERRLGRTTKSARAYYLEQVRSLEERIHTLRVERDEFAVLLEADSAGLFRYLSQTLVPASQKEADNRLASSVAASAIRRALDEEVLAAQELRASQGSFQLYKDGAGRYRFRLRLRFGRVGLVSEDFDSKSAAVLGIEKARRAVIDDENRFTIYADRTGNYRFRVVARNGEIVAVGEALPSEEAARHLIADVKRDAPDARVQDLTR